LTEKTTKPIRAASKIHKLNYHAKNPPKSINLFQSYAVRNLLGERDDGGTKETLTTTTLFY
jgi:hypothetical protein